MVPTNKMTLVLGLLRNCHYKLSLVNNNVRNLPQQLRGHFIYMYGQAHSQESNSLRACVYIILPNTMSKLLTATCTLANE